MAHLKNWMPDLTDEERKWFDKCPKAALFEIARQFAMRLGDEFSAEVAFKTMVNEWQLLSQQDIVPQKPPKAFAAFSQ